MSSDWERWRGETWQALVSREPYGLHFSVSGKGREPTDEEVEAARDAYAGILPSAEVTELHRAAGALNPYVRHFVSPEEVRRFGPNA
jgi:hypothetical protein